MKTVADAIERCSDCKKHTVQDLVSAVVEKENYAGILVSNSYISNLISLMHFNFLDIRCGICRHAKLQHRKTMSFNDG